MTNCEKQTEVSTIKLYAGPKNKTQKNKNKTKFHTKNQAMPSFPIYGLKKERKKENNHNDNGLTFMP